MKRTIIICFVSQCPVIVNCATIVMLMEYCKQCIFIRIKGQVLQFLYTQDTEV